MLQPMKTHALRRWTFLVALALLLPACGLDLSQLEESDPQRTPPIAAQPVPSEKSSPAASDRARSGQQVLRDLYRDHQSGVWIEADGTVERILRDDNKGDRHQRLIIDIGEGHTILIAHNIDLAKRVPVSEGDRVVFRGRYEWNDRGGVVHWTHHDPRGRGPGGWITHGSDTYR